MKLNKIIVLMVTFLFSQLVYSDSSVDWNKECASDIGLTVEEAQKKYGTYGFMFQVEEYHDMDELMGAAKTAQKSLENYCVILSSNYAYYEDSRNSKSIIKNFDYVTDDYVTDSVSLYKKELEKALKFIKKKKKQSSAVRVSYSK